MSHPNPKSRHHDAGTFPPYSRHILLSVSRKNELFPPTSKKQALRHWHMPHTFSRYVLNCLPYLRKCPTQLQKAGTMMLAQFPHIHEIFSRSHEMFPPTTKKRRHDTGTCPTPRDILLIVSRTYDNFPPKFKKAGTMMLTHFPIFMTDSLNCLP
jgi:hypothetical protein